jgi:hypothetical protein
MNLRLMRKANVTRGTDMPLSTSGTASFFFRALRSCRVIPVAYNGIVISPRMSDEEYTDHSP